MRPLILAASVSIVLTGVAGEAAAACAAPSVRVNTTLALNTLLTGNTVCVPATPVPDMTWQELHQSGGALVDFKRGPSSTTDPSERVGTWTIIGSDLRGFFVKHDYSGGGGSYSYSVWRNADGTHSFCSTAGNPEIVAKIKSGGNGCN